MLHIELEAMGSKDHQIPGDVYDALPNQKPIKDSLALPQGTEVPERGDVP